jgi:hypothetical protein
VDDAVVIDPDRLDNPVTNDGVTMRDLRIAISSRDGRSPATPDEDSEDGKAPTTDANINSALMESVNFELQHLTSKVKMLVGEVDKLETELEDSAGSSNDLTTQALLKQKKAALEQKKLRLGKLKE